MRIATANILNGRSLRDGRVDLNRLVEAMASLDADVLALQEVDRGQGRSHGADLTALIAERLGAEHRFAPAITGTPGLGWQAAADNSADDVPAYGVSLISRLPVDSWSVTRLRAAPVRSPVLLPTGDGHKVRMIADEPRVLLSARVHAPFGAVTVGCTHLSFIPGWNIGQLLQVRRALGGLPEPRILLGDLNLPGLLPTAITRWRPLMRGKTHPVGGPRRQFDHVLASGALPDVRAARAHSLEVSDHLAVVVEIADSFHSGPTGS